MPAALLNRFDDQLLGTVTVDDLQRGGQNGSWVILPPERTSATASTSADVTASAGILHEYQQASAARWPTSGEGDEVRTRLKQPARPEG